MINLSKTNEPATMYITQKCAIGNAHENFNPTMAILKYIATEICSEDKLIKIAIKD